MIRRTIGLGLLLLVACRDPLAPDGARVHLALTVSEPEMVVGDTVEIRVVGTNPTRNTLRFTTLDCPPFHVRILSAADQVVHMYPRTCNDMGVERVIEPGDSIVETVLFDGTVWPPGPFQAVYGEPPTVALLPGTYTIVAAPDGAEANDSNPVELRIRP